MKPNLVTKTARLERRFLESYIDDLMDRYVDPREEFEGWTPLDATLGGMFGVPTTLAYRNEQDLAVIRAEGRQLAIQNEFAICAIENRISYTVGTGHEYQVISRDGQEAPKSLIRQAQEVVDEFVLSTLWGNRQQEIVRRLDRDGECFLRFFPQVDGLQVRFVEPECVFTPQDTFDAAVHYGIRYTSLGGSLDMEQPEGYYVSGEYVLAANIQHRKANADLADPRGVPTFYSVRKNLTRAAKILRNMSTVAEIQAAIAMVRKHVNGSAQKIQQYVAAQADTTRTDGTRTQTYKKYPPGAIIDTSGGTEYDFPAKGIDVERYVGALQAELRAVASRLVMPEFMLTADASNANYSSTLVAEGPAVKMFERMQAEQIRQDRAVIERVIQMRIDAGELPTDTLDQVQIDAQPPNVQSRDRLKEAQADKILVDARAMSVRTMAIRNNLDPDTEERQIEDEMDRRAGYAETMMAATGDVGGAEETGGLPGQQGQNQGGQNDEQGGNNG